MPSRHAVTACQPGSIWKLRRSPIANQKSTSKLKFRGKIMLLRALTPLNHQALIAISHLKSRACNHGIGNREVYLFKVSNTYLHIHYAVKSMSRNDRQLLLEKDQPLWARS